MGPLDDDMITDALGELDGWEYDGEAITKTFTFDGFSAAIDFMTEVAPRIDEMDHHPEWTNVYSRVDVRLRSHDVDGVTERDLALARALDEAATG